MSESPAYLGIDFGHLQELCCLVETPRPARPRSCATPRARKRPPPSRTSASTTLVGEPAEAMLQAGATERQRVVASIKRGIASVARIAVGGGKRVTPVQVAAAILSKLKRDAEDLHFTHPGRGGG